MTEAFSSTKPKKIEFSIGPAELFKRLNNIGYDEFNAEIRGNSTVQIYARLKPGEPMNRFPHPDGAFDLSKKIEVTVLKDKIIVHSSDPGLLAEIKKGVDENLTLAEYRPKAPDKIPAPEPKKISAVPARVVEAAPAKGASVTAISEKELRFNAPFEVVSRKLADIGYQKEDEYRDEGVRVQLFRKPGMQLYVEVSERNGFTIVMSENRKLLRDLQDSF